MIKVRFILYLFVWAVFFQGAFVFAETEPLSDHIVLSQISGSPLQQKASRVLRAAYENIGVEVEFMKLPGRRALQFSNSGKTDGEVFRKEKVGSKYTNLMIVPTSYMSFRGFAYSVGSMKINTWDKLNGLRVGIQRGHVWAEEGSKGMHVSYFESNSDLFHKLLDGGIDVAIAGEFSFGKVIEEKGTTQTILKGEPLIILNLFHYLNKKHKELVPVLNAEFTRMLSNGEVDRILNNSNID
ncbi:MAG: transporter substrate-binding domain-containing protein [Sneathiella sp.]|nr:transporter substrate-binding domain-containing protein [Sneathiella sp.]